MIITNHLNLKDIFETIDVEKHGFFILKEF